MEDMNTFQLDPHQRDSMFLMLWHNCAQTSDIGMALNWK